MAKDKHLEDFVKKHFPYAPLKKAGFFTAEMRNDYKTQAKRVCTYFGFKSIFEYGVEEIRCHISYAEGQDPRPIVVNDKGELERPPLHYHHSIYA